MSSRESGIFFSGEVPAAKRERSEADVALIAELLLRKACAWRTFRARFDRLVYRCIGKVVGKFARTLGDDDVAEIYSEMYLRLIANDMHKLRSWNPSLGSSLSTWVGMIAIHTAHDYLRNQRREPRKETLDQAEQIPSNGLDPFELAAIGERAEITSRTLEAFSDRDRLFVGLYFSEGMSPESVAETMQISVKTVYSKRHKIQARLQLVLRGDAACAA
jgi:RNA polymerase sigma-70 factor, ECF subfamily